MLVAFFESIKYVGHLYPIAVLRIYLGYYYLSMGKGHVDGEFLTQPRLAATIMESVPGKQLPEWYLDMIQNWVVPNWQVFAYMLVYVEFLVGASLLMGFLVRPITLLAAFVTLNAVIVTVGPVASIQQTHLALFVVLFWVGAGRCLGLDYYFYKRHRGLWW
jgi:thiosulfate dehydrogenase [quinone] large subunit